MRHVVLVLSIAASAATAAQTPPQQPRFDERVDVERVIVDARVLDDDGSAVLGLTPEDFDVKIDGKLARVDSVTWFGGGGNSVPLDSTQLAGAADPIGAGRLIVFVFQKDLLPIRVRGLMRMLIELRQFLDALGPEDRVAVLSFDSRLKIWTDFTNDRARLGRLFDRSVLLEDPSEVDVDETMSLVARLNADKAGRAPSIEKALQLVGEALRPLPGLKTVVLVGYGFGTTTLSGVVMDRDYDAARRALVLARAAVISIDVTEADSHSLEAGLQVVSEATGGFYVKSNVNSHRALERLTGALAGYYVLFVEKPQGSFTSHRLDVRLSRGKGTVLAKSGFEN